CSIPWVDNKTTDHPKTKEFDKAYTQIQSYWFLHFRINFVCDPLKEDSIIAIIKSTHFDKLTPSEKEDLKFISTFLHNFKNSSSAQFHPVLKTKFLDSTSSSMGLKTRFLSILIIASPLGLVILLVNFLKSFPMNPSRRITTSCYDPVTPSGTRQG
ncbi:hypothetical protein VP01_12225g1, partial [Puccinia sorghi]